MLYLKTTVYIQDSKLQRRELRFVLVTLTRGLELDYDADHERPTPRHAWRVKQQWDRLHRRGCTMHQRAVPQSAIDEALANIRGQIKYTR